ncbi:MAG: hypothetical protein ACYCX5_03745 [Coriobacteriia bacterium]
MEATAHAPLRLRDSYSLLYAFTMVAFLPAIALLRTRAMYSYDLPYLVIMVAPPLLAMVLLTFVHDPSPTVLRTLGKALLYAVAGMILGATLFLVGSFFLAFLGPVFESHEWGGLQIAIGIIIGLFSLPLLLSAIARIRQLRPGPAAEAVAILFAMAALIAVGGSLLATDGWLTGMLRKDQVSYLVGGVFWYLPSYALVGGIIRSLGIV